MADIRKVFSIFPSDSFIKKGILAKDWIKKTAQSGQNGRKRTSI